MNKIILDQAAYIVALPGLLSPRESASCIAHAEERGFDTAPITTAAGFEHRPDVRNNTRVMFDDAALAGALWQRIRSAVPERIGALRAVGLNERLRVYRYDPGQQFRWHYDGSFVRSEVERSLLTFLVYLNDGFEGGATEFASGTVVAPRQGDGLLFLHPVLHQGAPVHQGRKYVLRSDVMYAKPMGT